MSSTIRLFWRTITGRRFLVGKDLHGNKYYEYPNDAGSLGRPRRQVKYVGGNMWPGVTGLPIQWTSWLSHTRPNPPTLEELKVDILRQERVKANALLIEERDREERLQQQARQSLPEPSEDQIEQFKGRTVTSRAPEEVAPASPPPLDEPQSWTPRTTIRRGG